MNTSRRCTIDTATSTPGWKTSADKRGDDGESWGDRRGLMIADAKQQRQRRTGRAPNTAIDDGGKVDKKEPDSADRGGADVDVDSTSFGASGGQPGQTDAKSADPSAHIPEVAKPEIIDYQGSHGQGTEDRPRDAFSEQMAGRPQPHNERPPEAPLGLNRNQAAVGASAVFAEPPVPRALTPRAIASLEKSLLAKVGAGAARGLALRRIVAS